MSNINEIAIKIEKQGGTLYLVGGAVRNKLLGIHVNDEDYCVTGISKEKFKELFPNAFEKGRNFNVFELEGKEFAMARKEIKKGKGHNQFDIESNEAITIDEDLSRRDITINSIAQNVLTNEIIDPFCGRNDLKNRIIRATTKSFSEDPLRVYRVARFAATLKFQVDTNTIKLMRNLKNELGTLSKERVFEEFKKVLSVKQPSIFFNVLKEAGVLDVHFKEIYDLIDVLQPEEYHPEGDAYNHTMLALDKCSELTNDLEIRFSVLVHDLGKGLTPKTEYPHHYGHEIKGVPLVSKLGYRINIPKRWIKSGEIACREHMRGGIFHKMSPSKKVEFIERVSKSNLGIKGLQIVVISDKTSTRNASNKNINFLDIGNKCLKEINGEYIKNKYDNIKGIEFKNKLHQERINWFKENINLEEY